MSRVCYICNSHSSNPLKKDEVNHNNVYLDLFRKYDYGSNSLSLLVQGDPDTVKLYQEEQKHNYKLIEEINNTRTKLFQVCNCSKKYFHPDCLIKHCLLTVTYTCKDCEKDYSLFFKQNSYNNKGSEMFFCKTLSLVVLILGLVVVSILLFAEVIKLRENEDLQHTTYLLGILLLIISLVLVILLSRIIKKRMRMRNTNSYVIKDTSNVNKTLTKQNSFNFIKNIKSKTSRRNISSSPKNLSIDDNNNNNNMNKDNIIDDIEEELRFDLPDSKNKDFIENYILFTNCRLKMDLMEIAELRVSNSMYLNHVLKSERKLIYHIEEGNAELEAEKNRNKEEVVDVMLEDNDKPKQKINNSITPIKPEKYRDRYHELPSQLLTLIDNTPQDMKVKRQTTFELDKENLDYNKLCVKKSLQKKNDKKNNLNNIFNFTLKNIKKRGGDKSKREEGGKVSILGSYLKKKRAKEEKEKNASIEKQRTPHLSKDETMLNKSKLGGLGTQSHNNSALNTNNSHYNNGQGNNISKSNNMLGNYSNTTNSNNLITTNFKTSKENKKPSFLGNFLKKHRAKTGKASTPQNNAITDELKSNKNRKNLEINIEEANKTAFIPSNREMLEPNSTSNNKDNINNSHNNLRSGSNYKNDNLDISPHNVKFSSQNNMQYDLKKSSLMNVSPSPVNIIDVNQNAFSHSNIKAHNKNLNNIEKNNSNINIHNDGISAFNFDDSKNKIVNRSNLN